MEAIAEHDSRPKWFIGSKDLGQIEMELDETEYYCRPYADMDDEEQK